MQLGESIFPMKEDFIMVHMHHACSHCRLFIVSGRRWVCGQCKNFQLCDQCVLSLLAHLWTWKLDKSVFVFFPNSATGNKCEFVKLDWPISHELETCSWNWSLLRSNVCKISGVTMLNRSWMKGKGILLAAKIHILSSRYTSCLQDPSPSGLAPLLLLSSLLHWTQDFVLSALFEARIT